MDVKRTITTRSAKGHEDAALRGVQNRRWRLLRGMDYDRMDYDTVYDQHMTRACHLCPWAEIERDLYEPGPHDHSRHFDYGARGGFIAPLVLPGWGWQSYWGMNEREPGFFAALWHKGGWSPVPDYALVSGHRYYKYPGCLVLQIVEITGLNSLKVVRGMAMADPQPTLRADDELTAALDDHPPDVAPDFQRGIGDALRWLLGNGRKAPGSQKRWPRSRPRPEHADAEEHMLLGRTMDYDHLDQQGYYGGADCALWWALGRCEELYPSREHLSDAGDVPTE
jgi:hypothetical protein